ncbi:MAG TPA: Calx-beta domain-containing protein [Vicinamibacteria bacterium]|jgi:hypothetical protein
MKSTRCLAVALTLGLALGMLAAPARAATEGGPLPGPLPLFPAGNWPNLDFEVVPLGYDPAPAASVLNIGDATVTEGTGGFTQVSFGITLSPPAPQAVTVTWATAPGTATSGADFTSASGGIIFTAGETFKYFGVTITPDALDEGNEIFYANLTGASGASIGKGQGVGTIIDDDPSPVVSIDDAQAAEGNTGNMPAPVTVRLSTLSGRDVTVAYATSDGTALAGSDYVAASGTVTIPTGVLTASIPLSLAGDVLDEVHEAFLVVLSSPVNATLGRSVAQVTILDDDGRAALCRPILVVPYTITAQGSYCLVRNLSTAQASGAAITINSDFVSLDLKGFKIGGGSAGAGTQAYGVYALDRKNVTVKNGNLRGFFKGVYLADDSGTFTVSQGHLLQGLLLDENTEAGLHVQGRGTVVRNTQVVRTGGTAALGADSSTYGIFVEGPGARVVDSDVTDTVGVGSGTGIAIGLGTGSNGAVVEKNRMANAVLAAASSGIRISGSSSVLALNNRLAVLGSGIEYLSSSGHYRDNLTSGVTVPFTGGTDAGNNQ